MGQKALGVINGQVQKGMILQYVSWLQRLFEEKITCLLWRVEFIGI